VLVGLYAIGKKIAEGVSFNADLFKASNSESYEKGGSGRHLHL